MILSIVHFEARWTVIRLGCIIEYALCAPHTPHKRILRGGFVGGITSALGWDPRAHYQPQGLAPLYSGRAFKVDYCTKCSDIVMGCRDTFCKYSETSPKAFDTRSVTLRETVEVELGSLFDGTRKRPTVVISVDKYTEVALESGNDFTVHV